MRRLTNWILIALLSAPTVGTCQANLPLSDELDEKVIFGQAAPFTGVLVPEATYREYQKEIEKYQFRLKEDAVKVEENPLTANLNLDVGGTLIKIGIGMILGVIIGFTIRP